MPISPAVINFSFRDNIVHKLIMGFDRDPVDKLQLIGRADAHRPVSVQGETVVLLAYGRSDSIVLKHRFRAILKVNLSSGEHSVLKMK